MAGKGREMWHIAPQEILAWSMFFYSEQNEFQTHETVRSFDSGKAFANSSAPSSSMNLLLYILLNVETFS